MVRTGGREAHQLAGSQSSSLWSFRVSISQRCSSTPNRQHDGHHLHKKVWGHPLPTSLQGKLSVMARSHQEEHHYSPPSMVIHKGQHRGRLPQQTQAVEVGFQASPVRVLEDLPETASLAHSECLHIQQESSGSQVHDLGARPQGNGNQCP